MSAEGRKPTRPYVVRVPVRGYATYLVDAHTAVEAAALVDGYDETVECVATEVERAGRARAWRDSAGRILTPPARETTSDA